MSNALDGEFRRIRFFTTVNHLQDLPDQSRAEAAFAGRSNVGKSSVINTLAGHGRLAFVSKTPGRTQHLNYFSLGQERFLVDLPGYGYARVPPAVKRHWEQLLSTYLQTRSALRGLILIMDTRRPLTPLDWGMLEWFTPTGKPVHILLSKSDKVSKNEGAAALRAVKQSLAAPCPQASVQLFSSLKQTGIDEAQAKLLEWLGRHDPG